MSQVKHVPPDQGKTFVVLGGDIVTLKAVGADTEGTYTVLETVVPAKSGPPRHVHRREDESFYVLEGEFEFTVDQETLRATAGSFVIAPRNIPHQFRNVGTASGKLLVIVRPSGFEKFIEEFAQLPLNEPPDFGKMMAIGAKYGVEFV